ncbi:hypothetical protein [Oryzihumus leptocrescens]|uniref:Uncharacterized protein n=1 Tax=Oryzihumus leptocrescens TaxID=297536 RepID=A0A542ZMH1_9MICO|nr:hypothetical protein [Oryzihumus leptocrescens]TQL61469.1 hypothetical protein FB474_2880 [Oryzihumus leptocrescens]
MTTRLEDDLRAALSGATAPSALSFDPDAVLRQGRRTVHTRRAIRACVVGLVTLAVAATGVAVATRDQARPRPAGPARSTTPAGLRPSATLGWGTDRFGVDYLTRDGLGGYDIRVYRLKNGVREQLGAWGGSGSPAASVLFGPGAAGVDGTVVHVGVAPSGISGLRPFFSAGDQAPADPARWEVRTAPLGGTGFEAVAVRFTSTADVQHLAGFDYTGVDGSLKVTGGVETGTVAPVTLLTGDEAALWADEYGSTWGIHAAGVTRADDLPKDGTALLSAMTVGAEGSPHFHRLVYGLLPRGVTKVQQVRYTLAPGASARGDLELRDLGSAGTAFLLELSSIDPDATRQVTSITWTTFDGRSGRQSFH